MIISLKLKKYSQEVVPPPSPPPLSRKDEDNMKMIIRATFGMTVIRRISSRLRSSIDLGGMAKREKLNSLSSALPSGRHTDSSGRPRLFLSHSCTFGNWLKAVFF